MIFWLGVLCATYAVGFLATAAVAYSTCTLPENWRQTKVESALWIGALWPICVVMIWIGLLEKLRS